MILHLPRTDAANWTGLARWPLAAGAALALAGAGGAHTALMGGAVMFAAVLGSVGGFAFGPICGIVLLGLVDDPVRLVQIAVLCSVANQAIMVWSLRRDIEWRTVGRFLAGGALGLPIGVWLLLHADRYAYSMALGLMLLLYCSYRLMVAPRTWRPASCLVDVVTGVLSGVTGGAAAFPSGPIIVRCGLKGIDPVHQRAVFQPVILVLQVSALMLVTTLQHAAGTSSLTPGDALLVPASLVGAQAGLALFRSMSTPQFNRLVTVLLLVSAVAMIV